MRACFHPLAKALRTLCSATLGSRRPRGERGSFTFAVVFWALMVMLLAGLVVDGGLAISERQHVGDVAEQAARAGANQLDQNALRAGMFVIDENAACAQANVVVNAAALDMPIVHCSYGTTVANGRVLPTMTVTIKTQYLPILVGLVYSKPLAVNAQATAHPQPGT